MLAGAGSARPTGQTTATPPLDLAALFGPRGLARDTNADGIADSVAARVILPDAPGVAGHVPRQTNSQMGPEHAAQDVSPIWSPDGRSIVF